MDFEWTIPERTLVLGCCGAGKSTLARRLGELWHRQVIHLDGVYWRPGWQEPDDKDAWRAQVEELSRAERWIIDGNYTSSIAPRLERADAVILLDYPRWLCMMRVLWRVWSHYGRRRPDMAPGCLERLDGEFLLYVWRFERDRAPQLRQLVEASRSHARVWVARDPAELEALLAKWSAMR